MYEVRGGAVPVIRKISAVLQYLSVRELAKEEEKEESALIRCDNLSLDFSSPVYIYERVPTK